MVKFYSVLGKDNRADNFYYLSVEFEHDLNSVYDKTLLEHYNITVVHIAKHKPEKPFPFGFLLYGTRENLLEYLADLSSLSADSTELLEIDLEMRNSNYIPF